MKYLVTLCLLLAFVYSENADCKYKDDNDNLTRYSVSNDDKMPPFIKSITLVGNVIEKFSRLGKGSQINVVTPKRDKKHR